MSSARPRTRTADRSGRSCARRPASLAGRRAPSSGRLVVAAVLAAAAAVRGQDVVVTEIHYHPTASQGDAEFVEVHNPNPLTADLSGFTFRGGIDYEFPEGTSLDPLGCAVVAGNPERLAALSGLDRARVLGPFARRLANEGEVLVLANPVGRTVCRVRYNNRGRWPVEAAGGGHTLELRDPSLDPALPGSWRASRRVLGTPGRLPDAPPREAVVPAGASWRWLPGREEPPEGWTSLGLDDAAWRQGPGGFGYGREGLATVLSDMWQGYISVFLRTEFTLEGTTAPGRAILRVDYDDGFVAYLNGVEIARSGVTGSPPPHDAGASLHAAGKAEEFEVPSRLLVAGANLLAIQGHNSSIASDDFVMIPELLVEEADGPGPLLIDGACFGPDVPAGESWAAIRNDGPLPVAMEGLRLSADPDGPEAFEFPVGGALAPGQRTILRGLPFSLDGQRLELFLSSPDGSRVLHAIDLDAPSGRRGHLALFPGEGLREGEREWLLVEGLEPQAERRRPVPPSLVLTEIQYHALDPLADPLEEYLEVHNAGTVPVDASGFRFSEGISFVFPPETVIDAGGYVVVARDPDALAARHGIGGVLGPFEGVLSNRGEVVELADRDGNPVDSVLYRDGGAWPADADGGGSSLELLDPREPNDAASAWLASAEGAKAEWTRFEYTGRHTSGEPEIHLLLLQSGSCLVDDVSVTADGVEHVPNGGFEEGLSPWIADGTHIHSEVTEEDAISGARSLRIRAFGRGDTGANHIEVETSPPLRAGKAYTVSLWARWERGTTRLMTRSYDQGLAKVHRLQVPSERGSPGGPSSSARNPGPAIDRLRQTPALARPGAPVSFRARIRDADGVASAALRYRRDGAASFETSPLLDDGSHGDGEAADGTWGGAVPAQPSGSVVEFFLEARDSLGNASRLPDTPSADDPDRTAFVYQADGSPVAGRIPSWRLVMTRAVREELATRSQTSNLLLPITVVVGADEIRHRAWLRQRGCFCSRGLIQPPIWRLKVGAEDPLAGREEINLDNQHADPTNLRDRITYHLMRRAGSIPYPSSRYVRVYRNGAFDKVYEDVDKVDLDFVEQSFGSSSGPLFKVDGWFEFPDAGERYVWKPGTMMYLGDDPEEYRWRYDNRGALEELDDWGPLVDLLRFIDPTRTPNDDFGAGVGARLPPDNWIRSCAVRVLVDAWDAVGVAGGKNAFLGQDPATGLWWMFPFDNDATFGPNRSTPLLTSSFPSLQRFFQHPAFVRRYYRTFRDLLDGPFRRDALDPILDEAYAILRQEAPTAAPTDLKTFVTERSRYVESQLPSAAGIRILTNGGDPVTTDKVRYVVLGEATLEADLFLLDGDPVEPIFLTATRFQLGIPLRPGRRSYVLQGLDGRLELVGEDSIEITSTAPPAGRPFRRGDANADGETNISDGIFVLEFLFLGGRAPPCAEAADANSDGEASISDAIFLLGFLFLGGEEPPAPGPAVCGDDPDAPGADLGCEEYGAC